MVQALSPFKTGDTIWVRSNNLKKSALAVVGEIFIDADPPYAEVLLAPGCDYFDWDHEEKFLPYDECRTLQVPLYRLELLAFKG